MARRFMDHQKTAFRYAKAVANPALFMEMRLGKTMVAIRRAKMYRPTYPKIGLRILVVAPNSALVSWQDELELEGETDYVRLMGSRDERLELLVENYRWCLLNKEEHLALPEISGREHCDRCGGSGKNNETNKRCSRCGGSGTLMMAVPLVNWDAVILDESVFIKTPSTRVTKFFINNFRDCPHRWILTGTPNPESDLEFWCQLAFKDGSAFGYRNYWHFRNTCFEQFQGQYAWEPKPGIATLIRKEVGKHSCIIRRKDVGLDTPKVYEKRVLELPYKLRKSYRKVEDEFILSFEGEELKRTKYSIATYQWLRQMCGGFIDGKLVWDGKIQELLNLLKTELYGEQLVVWFNYNNELFAVKETFDKQKISSEVMYGDPKDPKFKKRNATQRAFQAKKFQVILVQQAVAQMGANFSVSDTAIYYSNPTANLARIQTEDRIISVKDISPALYIDLLVEDSVDFDAYTDLKAKKFKSSLTVDRARKYCMMRRDKG